MEFPVERHEPALTSTSWSPRGELEAQEWAEHGRRLGALSRGAGWWIGDWLQYGNARFGERYERAAHITGYDVQTLMNMAYVASRFEAGRRREGLSFSHHAELAALDPEAQDHWLERAEGERLSVRCLRDELRRHRRRLEALERAVAATPAPARHTVCPDCGFRMERERHLRPVSP